MQKIAILAAPGFEETELIATLDVLRRLEFDVVVAGVQSLQVTSTHKLTIQADTTLDKLDPATLDAVILPGGPASWVLRDTPEVIRLVQTVHASGKLVAAICAAPIVLAKAGLLKGKRVTAYPAEAVDDDLKEASAVITRHHDVVLDGNIITAKGPAAALLFGYSIGEYLGKDLLVAELKYQMCYTGA